MIGYDGRHGSKDFARDSAAVFAAAGWATVGPYGLAFGAAPLFAYPLVLARQRRLTSPGPLPSSGPPGASATAESSVSP